MPNHTIMPTTANHMSTYRPVMYRDSFNLLGFVFGVVLAVLLFGVL